MKRRRTKNRFPVVPSASFAGFALLRAAMLAFSPGPGARLAAEWAGTALFALLPALFGLFYLEGDRSSLLPPGAPEAEHIRADARLGVLSVFPYLLLSALLRRLIPGEPAVPYALFLPALLLNALAIPVSRALLERGLLAGELSGWTRRLVPSAFFAATGGAANEAPARFLLALVLQEICDRQDSLICSILVHAAFGAAATLLTASGLAGWLSAGGMGGAALLLAGSLAAWRALLSALALSPCREAVRPSPGRRLRRREAALLLAAPILVLAATFLSLWLLPEVLP